MTLRRAIPDDAPGLARVYVEAWHKGYRSIIPDSCLQGLTVERRAERFRESLTSNSEETYVAELKCQILGFLTIGDCRDPDADHKATGEIWGIYLSPDYWRMGIGGFLSDQGESMLVSRGRSVATLWVLEGNHQAKRFYEAVGFKTDGATKEVNLGTRLKAVRYRKKLNDAKPQHPADG